MLALPLAGKKLRSEDYPQQLPESKTVALEALIFIDHWRLLQLFGESAEEGGEELLAICRHGGTEVTVLLLI